MNKLQNQGKEEPKSLEELLAQTEQEKQEKEESKFKLSDYLTDEKKEKAREIKNKAVNTIKQTGKEAGRATIETVRDKDFQKSVLKFLKYLALFLYFIISAPILAFIYLLAVAVTDLNENKILRITSATAVLLIIILLWFGTNNAFSTEDLHGYYVVCLFILTVVYFIAIAVNQSFYIFPLTLNSSTVSPIFMILLGHIKANMAKMDDEFETQIFTETKTQYQEGNFTQFKVFRNEKYGYLRESYLYKCKIDVKVESLSDKLITQHKVVPQNIAGQVFLIKDGKIFQDVEALLDIKPKEKFLDELASDENINFAFDEVAEKLEAQKQKELEEEKARKEQLEQQQLEQAFKEKGLNDKAIKIITRLKKNQAEWGISVHDLFGRSMEFTKNYLKVRVDLMESTTRKDLERNVEKIGQKVGILPRIERGENESSAYLTFVLNTNIRGKKLTAQEIREDAEHGELKLGQTIFGDYIVEYNQKDEEDNTMIAGLQGSGKSYMTMFKLYSRMYLKSKEFDKYMYDEITIASTKPADYLKLGWDKIGVTILNDPIATFKYLINLHKEGMRRKNLFTEERVGSFYEYNKAHKNTDGAYLSRKLFVFDEVQNMLSQAKKILISLGGKKVKLSDAIVDLHIMIVKEHRSQGIGTFLIPQTFDAKSLGEIGDVYTNKLLGRAKESTWNYYDSTQSITKYLKHSKENQGLFFKTGSGLPLKKGLKEEYLGDWVKLNLNYFDFDDLAKNSTRIFDNSQLLKDIENTTIDIVENGLDMFNLDDINIEENEEEKGLLI